MVALKIIRNEPFAGIPIANTSSSVAARVPTQINESGGTCQVLGTHCGLQLEFAYTLW